MEFVERSKKEHEESSKDRAKILAELGPRKNKAHDAHQKEAKPPETRDETAPAQKGLPLEKIVDIAQIRSVSIEDPTLDITERLAKARGEIDAGLEKVNSLLLRIPPAPTLENEDMPYRTTNATRRTHLSDERNTELALTITTTGYRIFGTKKTNAKLEIKTELSEHSVSYDIPSGNVPLSSPVAAHIVCDLQHIVSQERYTPAEETAFVEAIGSFIGSPQIVRDYFTKLYAQLRTDLQKDIEDALKSAQNETDIVMTRIRGELKELSAQMKSDDAEKLLASKREKAERELAQKYEELTVRLSERFNEYDAAYSQYLDSMRIRHEEEHKTRLVDIESERARLEEERKSYSARKQELEQLVQWSDLDEDAHKILPGFQQIFADINMDSWTFETKINHDLRVFYMTKLKTDLKKHNKDGEQVSIPVALTLIETICQKWVEQGKKPNAIGIKNTYAAFRAVLDHIKKHTVPVPIMLDRLRAVNINGLRTQTYQPGAEQVVEYLLGEDVDMNKYLKDLHNLQAIDKHQLGVL